MKLIDILARDLKDWPWSTSVVGQACDGSLHLNRAFDPCLGHSVERFEKADDWAEAHVTRAEWQAAVDALNKPAAPEWNGEGVPPVGATVEIQKGEWGVRSESECFLSRPVLVAASFKTQELGIDMIAVDGGWLGCEVFRAEMARPVRTPEQIAAEQRERQAKAMFDLLKPGEEVSPAFFKKLYDAGFRKHLPPGTQP